MSLILFLILFISHALSSLINNYTRNTEEPLGCLYNTTNIRYYYEISPNSSIQLPTCRNAQLNSNVYWFTYSEYCRNGFDRNRHFATVFPNGTSICQSRLASPTLEDCRQNYRFNIDWTIVDRIDQKFITEYVCSNSRTVSISDRPVRYSILFRSVTQVTTVADLSTSTFSSALTISTESNTNDTSAFPSTADLPTKSESESPMLIIVVSTSAAFLTIASIIGSVIGYIYYRRRRVRQEQKAMQMECLK